MMEPLGRVTSPEQLMVEAVKVKELVELEPITRSGVVVTQEVWRSALESWRPAGVSERAAAGPSRRWCWWRCRPVLQRPEPRRHHAGANASV